KASKENVAIKRAIESLGCKVHFSSSGDCTVDIENYPLPNPRSIKQPSTKSVSDCEEKSDLSVSITVVADDIISDTSVSSRVCETLCPFRPRDGGCRWPDAGCAQFGSQFVGLKANFDAFDRLSIYDSYFDSEKRPITITLGDLAGPVYTDQNGPIGPLSESGPLQSPWVTWLGPFIPIKTGPLGLGLSESGPLHSSWVTLLGPFTPISLPKMSPLGLGLSESGPLHSSWVTLLGPFTPISLPKMSPLGLGLNGPRFVLIRPIKLILDEASVRPLGLADSFGLD
ncbi:hypothetical protein CRG98_015907, partial [Punica granatum]